MPHKISHCKEYNSAALSTFTMLCSHHLDPILFQNILIPTKDISTHRQALPVPALPLC